MSQENPTLSNDRPAWKNYLGVGWLIAFLVFFFCLPIAVGNPARWYVLLNVDAYFPGLFQPSVTPSGWQYLTQRVEFLLVAGLILASSYALGQQLLAKILSPQWATDLERALYAIGLGLSSWSLITLTLGWFGILDRWLFVVLLAAPIVVAAIQVRLPHPAPVTSTTKKSSKRQPVVESVWQQAPWRREIYLGLLLPFAAWIILGAMLPSTDFDVKEYHLQGPKEWMQAGQIEFLPHNVYTSFPFMTEMLSLLAMVVHGDWYWGALAGKTVLMSFAFLTSLTLFVAGQRLFSTQAGFWAALIYLTIPWTYRISTIALVEGAVNFYLAISLLATVRVVSQLRDGEKPTMFVLLAGLFAGTAMAGKYPGVISVVIPLGLFILWTVWKQKPKSENNGGFLKMGLVYSAGVLLTVGPWLLKNLIETGNPVYPLLYSVFGGVDWDVALNQKWKAGHGVPDYNLWKMLTEWSVDLTAGHTWLSPLLYGLAPLAFLKTEHRKRVVALSIYVFFLFATWWLLTHRLDRFWLPLLPVVALLAGAGATTLVTAPHRLVLRMACLLGLLFNALMIFSGLSGYNAFLADLPTSRERITGEYQSGLHYLNQTIDDDSRVLMVGEAQVFDCEFPLVYNTVFDRSLFQQWTGTEDSQTEVSDEYRLKSVAEIRKTFVEKKVTHIYVNWAEVLRYRTTYGYTHFVEPSRFQELINLGFLRPVKRFASLLELPSGHSPPPGDASLQDGNSAEVTGVRNPFSKNEQKQLDDWGQPLFGKLSATDDRVWVHSEIYEVAFGD